MAISAPVSKSLQHNKELASIFRQMSDCYKYLGKDQRFRAIAYDTAAKTLANMSEPVDIYSNDIKALDELKGVGESIAEKIVEYLTTGKIRTFEKLKKEVPGELLELMDIEGFGPATIRSLHEGLGINTRDELIRAIEKGKLESLRGFGAQKIRNIKRVLKLEKQENKRLPYRTALEIGNEMLAEIKKFPGVKKAMLAGSLRRKKETIGDIDIVVCCNTADRKRIVGRFIELPQVARVLAKGESKASVILQNKNVQVDMRLVLESEYGSALLYFTGSKDHNILLRQMAKDRGWKVNEYGVFDARSGRHLAGKTEEEIYDMFGLDFIPPETREGKDELEKAKR